MEDDDAKHLDPEQYDTLGTFFKSVGLDLAVLVTSEMGQRKPMITCEPHHEETSEIHDWHIKVEEPSADGYKLVTRIECIKPEFETDPGFQFEDENKDYKGAINSAIKIHKEKYEGVFFYHAFGRLTKSNIH